VSFDLFLATVCCLPNVLLFGLAISILASVLTDDDGQAVLLTSALALALCGIPVMAYLAQNTLSPGAGASSWALRLSPAYGPWLIFHRFSPAPSFVFWHIFSITLCWTILCRALAAFALARLWRTREAENRTAILPLPVGEDDG